MSNSLHHHVHKLAVLNILIDQGSFRAACQSARLSQSAVSQIVTQLESLFGTTLIVRDQGRITATPTGAELIRRVRPILASLDELTPGNFAASAIPDMSWLSFGTYESIAIDILPSLTKQLWEKIPNLDLQMRTGRSSELCKMVKKGELCMAVVVESDEMDGVEIRPLVEDRLGLFVGADSGLASRGIDAINACGYGTIAPGKNGYPNYYKRFIKTLERIRKPSLVSDSFEALRALATSGTMAAVLPLRVANRVSSSKLANISVPGISYGQHRIILISRNNCDPNESDFLASELRILLKRLSPDFQGT